MDLRFVQSKDDKNPSLEILVKESRSVYVVSYEIGDYQLVITEPSKIRGKNIPLIVKFSNSDEHELGLDYP